MFRYRFPEFSSVFMAKWLDPCSANTTNASKPPVTVYQSIIPGLGPVRQFVHSGRKK